MKVIRSLWAYVGLILIAYLWLPRLIVDTGSGILILLGILPFLVLVLSVIWRLWGMAWYWLGLFPAVLFVLPMFLYMNESAWIYCLYYGVIALCGVLIARMFGSKK